MNTSTRPSIIRASEGNARRLEWLWHDRIPSGSITLLVGDGGLGKSLLTVELAARLSRGELEGEQYGRAAASLLLSVEDDSETTIKPRLLAANADLSHVHYLQDDAAGGGLLTLPDDHATLSEWVAELNIKLVVFDPLTAFLSERVDSYKDQSVRRVLGPLAAFARQWDVAFLGVMHVNRRDTADSSARISGSSAFRNAARSALIFGTDPSDPEGKDGPRRVVAQNKANLTRPGQASLSLEISEAKVTGTEGDEITAARIRFVGDCMTTADALLSSTKRELSDAERFLAGYLADGPRPSTDLLAVGGEHGFSHQNLRTASKHLGVISKRNGAGWEWVLPTDILVSSTSSTS